MTDELIALVGIIFCFTLMGVIGIIYALYPYLYGKQLLKLAELDIRRKELENWKRKKLGRPKAKVDKFKVLSLKNQGHGIRQIARELNSNPATIHRIIKRGIK